MYIFNYKTLSLDSVSTMVPGPSPLDLRKRLVEAAAVTVASAVTVSSSTCHCFKLKLINNNDITNILFHDGFFGFAQALSRSCGCLPSRIIIEIDTLALPSRCRHCSLWHFQ